MRDRLGGLEGLLLGDAHRQEERVEVEAIGGDVELHHGGQDGHRGLDALVGVARDALLGHRAGR